MCTISPYDFKLQVVHCDLSWETDPDGFVKKAEQTGHFLWDTGQKLVSVLLWGSFTVPLQAGRGLQNIISTEQRIISCPLPFLEAYGTPGDPNTNITCLNCWPLEGIRKPWNQTKQLRTASTTALSWHSRAPRPKNLNQFQTSPYTLSVVWKYSSY